MPDCGVRAHKPWRCPEKIPNARADGTARASSQGDVKAFVKLTRRFQHAAFSSALALARDFQQAEDVVQEAFPSAWSGLPTLVDPAAFPDWLRHIVRHHAFRVLLRRQLEALPLSAGDDLASNRPATDLHLEQRHRGSAQPVNG
jgi:DNA-directed RNA polymerase specialized sigma24 family protein